MIATLNETDSRLMDVTVYDGLPSSMTREFNASAADISIGLDAALKADIIGGNTFDAKDALKAAGCWFCRIGGEAVWLTNGPRRAKIYAVSKENGARLFF